MKWTLPNQITVARMILSVVFFVLLACYEPQNGTLLLKVSFVMFVLAALTDILDGYLARKLNQVSAFGRIVDPIMDKVMVCGGFIFLMSSVFRETISSYEQTLPHWLTGQTASSIQAWMLVVIIGREFLISGLRGYSESIGKQFPATWSGKLKMFLQCFALGAILFVMAWTPDVVWTIWVKIISVWLAVLVTLYSGVIYIVNARGLFKE